MFGQSVINQSGIGTVSRATLGKLLRDRQSMYRTYQVLQCHLEMKLILKLKQKRSSFLPFI